MTNQVVIITGASSGIGYQVAENLCGEGYDVILACRSGEKASNALAKIRQVHPKAMATYMNLDVSSLDCIRRFVDQFHNGGKPLNILINNAGIRLSNRDKQIQYSIDNMELTMATNYMGHFLLTNLLLEDLKKSAAVEDGIGRVLNITSAAHDVRAASSITGVSGLLPLDLDNLFLLKGRSYNSAQAYKNSKVAQVMFSYELARRVEQYKVTVNSISPGFFPSTELLRHAGLGQRIYQRTILDGALKFAKLTQSVAQAAHSICSVATAELYKEISMSYFSGIDGLDSSEESLDEEAQKKLFELSARYVHLEGYEPLTLPDPSVAASNHTAAESNGSPKKGKAKATPEKTKGKASQDKNTPDTEGKARRLFSFGRSRKSSAGCGEEGKKVDKIEERKEEESVVVEGELGEGVKAIDLSMDVERKDKEDGKEEGKEEGKEGGQEGKEKGKEERNEESKKEGKEEVKVEVKQKEEIMVAGSAGQEKGEPSSKEAVPDEPSAEIKDKVADLDSPMGVDRRVESEVAQDESADSPTAESYKEEEGKASEVNGKAPEIEEIASENGGKTPEVDVKAPEVAGKAAEFGGLAALKLEEVSLVDENKEQVQNGHVQNGAPAAAATAAAATAAATAAAAAGGVLVGNGS